MHNSDIKIDLHDAHVTQYNNTVGKSDWFVRRNGTNDELATLPGTMDEESVFAAMRMAREFELKAFNIGIELGKKKANEYHKDIIADLASRLREAIAENERIATILDKHIKGEG